MLPVLYFLAGPTACGKTALSLEWAADHGAEILSCDAFCIYRGMDIGTAKPAPEERGSIPHHGLDIADASRAFSVGAYAEYARNVVNEVTARGVPLLITGGSGFYLKSFFAPVTDTVVVPEEVRLRVIALEEQEGLEAMLARLDQLNPSGTGDLARTNPRRVANALMRCEASGKSMEVLAAEFARQPVPFSGFHKRLCLLDRDPVELRERVNRRTREMIQGGLIEEVRRLRSEGIENNPSAASAIGYRETLAYLDGAGDLEWLETEITTHTNQLIKKQRTWFRNQVPAEQKVLIRGAGSASELFL